MKYQTRRLLIKKLLVLSALGLGTVWLSACAQNDPSVKALVNDYKASQQIKKKQNEFAQSLYYKVLETDTGTPSVHSNLGVLFGLEKKNEESLKSLQLALRLATEQGQLDTQFVVRFNLGTYYGSEKKITEALENYQAALELKPDSKVTKHNIELLLQKNSGSESGDKKDKNEEGSQDQKEKQNESGKSGEQDQKKDGEKDKEKDQEDDKSDTEKGKKPEYKENAKYKPRPFNGDELSENDVKNILGELKNQEQKIRANFEKRERKDKNNEKDW